MNIKDNDYFDKAEKAIDYLRDSEQAYASLKAQHQALKERIKITESSRILDSNEKTQGMKEHDARSSEDYLLAVSEWESILQEFYLVEAKRKRAELTIEMYRSVNSALKRGNI